MFPISAATEMKRKTKTHPAFSGGDESTLLALSGNKRQVSSLQPRQTSVNDIGRESVNAGSILYVVRGEGLHGLDVIGLHLRRLFNSIRVRGIEVLLGPRIEGWLQCCG